MHYGEGSGGFVFDGVPAGVFVLLNVEVAVRVAVVVRVPGCVFVLLTVDVAVRVVVGDFV